MKITTYICDNCKTQDTTNKIDLITVKIVLFDHSSPVRQSQWCRRCLASYGLVGIQEDPKNPVIKIEPSPTLEDLIREIIREEIQS